MCHLFREEPEGLGTFLVEDVSVKGLKVHGKDEAMDHLLNYNGLHCDFALILDFFKY